MAKTKEPVRLRRRLLASGLTSLYLDIYIDGRRSYEYLRLYLVPEKSRKDKDANRETLRLAEDIRAKRMVEVRNNAFGFNARTCREILFLPYFDSLISARGRHSDSTPQYWQACRTHMLIYDSGLARRTFADIDEQWLRGFRRYLTEEAVTLHRREGSHKQLASNSAACYWKIIKTCINDALKNDIIAKSPLVRIEPIAKRDGTRQYLTIEELEVLADTDCGNQRVKEAFLFSCFTGLRLSDIKALRWGQVQRQGDFTRIIFAQQKTGGLQYLDINEQASRLMGERRADADAVFSLPCLVWTEDLIRRWVASAGISKRITFHCARHTFATLMLYLGTDIYTVSKLLGHSNVSVTQVYAKVMDKSKQEAVSRIPSILGKDGKSKKTQINGF